MRSPKPFNTFRVLSRNVNTMSITKGYVNWKAVAHAIHECEADAIALQETNLAWNKIHRKWVQQILQASTGHATIATSSSSEISNTSHQWGGTLQAMLGDWTSRTAQLGNDTSGLGCWSFIELQAKEDRHFIILTGYQVCEDQKVDPGSNNTFNQQYRLLHQQGHRQPDPRTQFVTNLIQLVQTWRSQNKAVLVCINANENPEKQSTDGITKLFTEMDLINLHSNRQPGTRPPTYNWGSKPINLCAGSPEFAAALEAAWYLPFREPIGLRGDHQTLGLDFNIETLFRQNAAMATPTIQWGVNSNNTKLVQQFCKQVIEECRSAEIHERIHSLLFKPTLPPTRE